MLVLYVDDERNLLEIGKLFLEESGEFSVDTVSSAPAALEILNKKNYDAIISDYLMPEMDGIEFLKKVRATGSSIPFIIFTGRGREEVVIEALNNGADFYLQKGGEPDVQFAELMHVIRQSVLIRRTLISLAEQEQRYHDLQNANDLIQSVAPDGHFLFANKKWLDTLGYEEHELPNLIIFDIIHEESLKHCRETFHRVISGENVGIIDAVFKTRDGKKVFVEGMASCKMVDGKPQFTRGIFDDVTDRKMAEAALKESEARYRNVVEDQTEFISRFRPNGTHVFVNEAYCRYFNKKREEIIGKRFVPDIPEEDGALVREHFASLTREHPVATITHRIIMPDGRIRWQQWSNRAVFDEEGHITEYQSVGRDITDLKEAESELLRKNEDINAAYEELTATEEELRQNYDELSKKEQALREGEETFRAMVEQSTEGIIIVDFFGMLLFANRRAQEIVESTKDQKEIGKTNVLDFISPELRDNAIHDLMQVSAGIDSYLVNYKIITLEKREKWIECIGKKISYKGSPAMLLSFRDATERRKTELAIRENERKFRTIFESSLYPICINSIPDGTFIAVNPAFQNRSGYTGADLLGKTPVEAGLISPEDYSMLTSHMLSAGKIENVPLDLTGKDGIRIHVLFSTAPVKINDRPAILTTVVDVTELKKVEEELLQKNEDLRTAYKELTATEEELRQNYDELSKKEQALRESEERYRTLYRDNPTMFFTLDSDGTVISVNQFGASQLGYGVDELEGQSVLKVFYEEDRRAVTDQLKTCLQSPGEVFHWQFRKVRKDGSLIWVEEHARAMISPGGNLSVLVVCQDITDRKRAEEALRQSERKYRNIIENMQDMVYRTDRDGNLIMFSPHGVKAAGYDSEEEMIGLNVANDTYQNPEERKRFLAALKEKGYVENYPLVLKARDGTPRFVTASSHFYYDDQGNVLGVEGILHDITDLRKKEQELRASEERYRALYRDNPIMLFTLDSDGTVISVNQFGASQLGYGVDELEGQSVLKVFYEEDRRAVTDQLKTCLQSPGEVFHWQFRKVRKDGSLIWVDEHARAMISPGGNLSVLVVCQDITDRKRAEEALRQSEEKYRTILENIQDIYYRTDAEGNLILVSPSAAKLFGVDSASEFYGKNIAETIYYNPEERQKFLAELNKSGSVTEYEVTLKKPDGTPIVVSTSSHNYYDASGKYLGVEGIFRDITDRKRVERDFLRKNEELNAAYEQLTAVEEELRQNYDEIRKKEQELRISEKQYRDLYRDNPTMFFTLDSRGKVLSVNQFGASQLGYTVGELEGQSVLKVFYPEDHPAVTEQLQVCLRSPGQEFHWQLRKVRKDGSMLWVGEHARAVTGSKGDLSVLVVCQDITEWKRAEQDLLRKNEELNTAYRQLAVVEGELWTNFSALLESQRQLGESETRLHAIVDGSPIPNFVIDKNHRVIYWNKALEKYSGILARDIIGTSRHWQAFYPAERPCMADLLVDQNIEKIPQWYAGKYAQSKFIDGAYEATDFFPSMRGTGTWLFFTAAPIRDANGEIIGAVETLEDITERKQAEEALSQANKKLNLLSSITRHDILNQLVVLRGHLALSKRFLHDPEKLREFIKKEIKAAQTIEDQISFTRTYQNMGVHAPAWQNVNASISRAVAALPMRSVKVEVDRIDLEVFADPLLEKVFYNLIDNALRYGGDAITIIRISSHESGRGMVIVCEDDGMGISGEAKRHLFKRGHGKNTGLGLFLVREILGITGITIRETSEPGKGARFEIIVPEGIYRFMKMQQ